MKSNLLMFILILAFILSACSKQVHLTFLHANDVYEMTTVTGGKYGGLARVQTLLKQLRNENPNTYAVLSGDLLSPSAIGAAKINGNRIGGEQMVDVLGAMDWNFMTIGNHEFDKGIDFQKQALKAKFDVFSSNVFKANGQRFDGVKDTILFEVDTIKVGLVGIMLRYDGNKKGLSYKTIDQFQAAKKAVLSLRKNKADIVILVTHQSIKEDIQLAEMNLDVDIIMGGHEHENMFVRRGDAFIPISKADANARSVFIHRMTFDTQTRDLDIDSRLTFITDALTEDRKIKQLVSNWKEKAFEAYRQAGIEPTLRIATITEKLNGLESAVRNRSTRLTQIIADSAANAYPKSDLSIVNGGSIRIDDILMPGEVIMYDVLRILPFGGKYTEITLPGRTLLTLINQGLASQGSGSYLHLANVGKVNGEWQVNKKTIEPDQIYRAAIGQYLQENGSSSLPVLKEDNADITVVANQLVDVRQALANELKMVFGKASTPQ